jgi:glyoxylase-like metal-dependent hydrolase (beta-lactamase superfamily II)
MRTTSIAFLVSWLFLFVGNALADTLKVQKVTDGVYALVGELGQRSETNLGNNATYGVIETKEGIVLIDSGGTRKGAERIHALVKTISDKPIVLVINTGGQDQRWLGNGYFREAGARIIASEAAVADQKARYSNQLTALENLVGKAGTAGTRDVYADQTFASSLDLTVGGVDLQLRHGGTAHTPGDIYVWLPQKKVVFTGDIVYVERILVVGPMSNSRSWIEVFKQVEKLKPDHVVPGHGDATDIGKARADTLDYLVMLRTRIKEFTNGGGSMARVASVDQSQFSYLENFDLAKGRNAEAVALELEWE